MCQKTVSVLLITLSDDFFNTGFMTAQRNLADALRGFELISLVCGTTASSAADWYMPFLTPSRNDCLTMRSSPLWKLIIPILPPGRRQYGATLKSSLKQPSSSLTSMRSAWNTRAAGCKELIFRRDAADAIFSD
jgi:hypothetical protein